MSSQIIKVDLASSKAFQYQLLPSAFRIAELPTYACWKALKYASSLIEQSNITKDRFECYKKRTFSVLLGVSGFLGGMVAYPLMLCSTPVTILADIIIGIAECAFCLYQEVSKEDLLIIAHRKFVVSPCQQLSFLLGSQFGGISFAIIIFPSFVSSQIAFTTIAATAFKASMCFNCLFWLFAYSSGQSYSLERLPKALNDPSFNIFIESGFSGYGIEQMLHQPGVDPIFENNPLMQTKNTYQDQPRPNPFPSQSENNVNLNWNNFIANEISELSSINDVNLSQKYIDFKKNMISKVKPEVLLGLSRNFTPDDVRNKFLSLCLILHPDRNQPRIKEATAMFKVLHKAYEILGSC